MGPLLVLVCPCFRENVIVICKIVSFLCTLDNFALKNVIFSFLEIKFRDGAHLKKRLFLTYFSHFLVTRKKTQKLLQHISHLHTITYFAHPIDFFASPLRIYHVWFLSGANHSVDSHSRQFGATNE